MFLEMKLRGLVPNFRFHVSVSDLHIPMIGSPIFLQQNRQIDHGNIYIAPRIMNVGIAVSFPGIFVSNFRYSVFAVGGGARQRSLVFVST
jgi:hypothetical protein